MKVVLKNKTAWLGIIFLAVVCILAIFAPFITSYDPYAIDLPQKLAKPSIHHIFGCDSNGGDIFTRLLYGARISLCIGFTVVVISGTLGVFIGLCAGFYGGVVDAVLMRIVDILLAFPGLLLAIALVAVTGPSIANVIFALSVLGWVPFARLARGQVLTVRERDYIKSAQISGQSHLRIMTVHIFPNILAPIIVQATFAIASVIISESSLSFLGLGAPPGTPSWGAMLSAGKQVILMAPHVSLFPGLAIMLTVISFNLVGDALRDTFDPKSRKE